MLGKLGLLKMKTNYIKIPLKCFHMRLPSDALSVYTTMASLPIEFNPSLRFLAKTLRLSKTTVVRNVNLLIELNIITKIRSGDLKIKNLYRLNPPSEWKEFVTD